MFTSERAEVESIIAEVRRIEERVRAAEHDLEGLRVAHACVDELMAESA